MRRVTILLALTAALPVFAGENLLTTGNGEGPDALKDWGRNVSLDLERKHSGTASIALKYDMCASPDFIPIDSTKTYRLSGWFRSKETDKPSRILLHLRFHDKDKKEIKPCAVQPVASISALAADAKAGATTVRVRKSDWKTKKQRGVPRVSLLAMAFDAKEDESDLPNHSAIRFKTIKEEGDDFVITLEKPLPKDYPAGTPVRQHVYRDYPWDYDRKGDPLGTEWRQYSITVGPEPVQGAPKQNFIWKGAAYGRPVVMCRSHDRENGPVLLFDDLVLEEVENPPQ